MYKRYLIERLKHFVDMFIKSFRLLRYLRNDLQILNKKLTIIYGILFSYSKDYILFIYIAHQEKLIIFSIKFKL